MHIETAAAGSVPFVSVLGGAPFTTVNGGSNVLVKTNLPAGTLGEAVVLADGSALNIAPDAPVWPSNAKVVIQL